MPLSTPIVVPPALEKAAAEELAHVAARIAREIAAAEAAPAEEVVKNIVFRVGDLELALPLTSVREVVTPSWLSRVPRAPAAVLGIMNLRGRVVAVVDLLHALPGGLGERAHQAAANEAPGAAIADGKILILERGAKEMGLLVKHVIGIAAAPEVAASAARGAAGPVLLEPNALAQSIEALVE